MTASNCPDGAAEQGCSVKIRDEWDAKAIPMRKKKRCSVKIRDEWDAKAIPMRKKK
nr:hypothetical protein [Tanacetum cinerariifolium]